MKDKIKIFHVEDYQIMRDGIAFMLNNEENFQVVGSFADGEHLLNALEQTPVDIIILDLYLDGMEDMNCINGFEIARRVHARFPTTKLIAHSAYDDADRVKRIIKEGAAGFVSKKSGFRDLVMAVNAVHAGEIYICSKTSERLKNLNKFLMGIESNLRGKDEFFSVREKEVLYLLAHGKSSRQIAAELFITERTVESHRKNMLEKVNVKNTVELIAYASNVGLLKR